MASVPSPAARPGRGAPSGGKPSRRASGMSSAAPRLDGDARRCLPRRPRSHSDEPAGARRKRGQTKPATSRIAISGRAARGRGAELVGASPEARADTRRRSRRTPRARSSPAGAHRRRSPPARACRGRAHGERRSHRGRAARSRSAVTLELAGLQPTRRRARVAARSDRAPGASSISASEITVAARLGFRPSAACPRPLQALQEARRDRVGALSP